MAFKSLLFVNGESIKEDKEAINDLRINFILDGIVNCSIESVKDKVKDVLYRRLLDKNDILFRQNTLEDIETEEVHNSINTFSNRISKIERLLELSKKSNFEITKHGWFLEAVITYIRSLDDLNSNLAKFDLKSEGLREFAGYLKSYLNSDYFTNLKDKSKTIKEKLGNITFNVTIKENRIYVNRYNDEKDLNNDIQQLFERLASEEIESIEPEIIESNILSNVEEKILEFVKKLKLVRLGNIKVEQMVMTQNELQKGLGFLMFFKAQKRLPILVGKEIELGRLNKGSPLPVVIGRGVITSQYENYIGIYFPTINGLKEIPDRTQQYVLR